MSGFKMDRKLRMLVWGILAFALANPLQSSSADESSEKLAEGREHQQKCVAKVADLFANTEITEPVKVLVEKTRKYYPNYVAFFSEGPSKDYMKAMAEIGPQDGCNKMHDSLVQVVESECARYFTEEPELNGLDFISQLVQVSPKVLEVLYAQEACTVACTQYPSEERLQNCAAKMADYIVNNVELSESAKRLVKKLQQYAQYPVLYSDTDTPDEFDLVARTMPQNECDALVPAYWRMIALDCSVCIHGAFNESIQDEAKLLAAVSKISQQAHDILYATDACRLDEIEVESPFGNGFDDDDDDGDDDMDESKNTVELADHSDDDRDKLVSRSDEDRDKVVDDEMIWWPS
jgi:hypothetical protein